MDEINEIDAIRGMDQAMVNSYNIIVGNTTVDEMLLNSEREGLFFAHDIEKDATQNDIKLIKDYFEKMEDFERCVELSRMIL
jgi:hypothetical protein